VVVVDTLTAQTTQTSSSSKTVNALASPINLKDGLCAKGLILLPLEKLYAVVVVAISYARVIMSS